MASPAVAPAPSANGTPPLPSAYDIHDPEFTYSIPEPAPKPAAAAAGAAVPPTAPAQPAGNPPVPAATPAPSTQRHPDWLLAKAAEQGLNPILIERLDKDDLTRVVMDTIMSRNSEAAAASAAAVIARPAAPPAAPAAPAVPQFDWGVHDDTDDAGRPVKKQFTDNDVHPAVAAHIKSQAKRIEALEQNLASMAKNAASAGNSRIEQEFDAAFNKMGGIFGVGSAASLKGKPEFERRTTVFAAVRGMMQTLPKEISSKMTIEQAVTTMAKSMFNADPVAAAAGPAVPTADQYRTGGVQPPTQRRGSDQPLGRDRAVEEASAWWKENQASGAIPQNGGTSLDEFLPM